MKHRELDLTWRSGSGLEWRWRKMCGRAVTKRTWKFTFETGTEWLEICVHAFPIYTVASIWGKDGFSAPDVTYPGDTLSPSVIERQ